MRRLRERTTRRRLPDGVRLCDRSAAVCDARTLARRLREQQRLRASQGGFGW